MAPMIFLFGNPTRAFNFGSKRERWEHRSVDSRKCRFINTDQLEQCASDYGEDSDFCRVRIKGECPRPAMTAPPSSCARAGRPASSANLAIHRLLCTLGIGFGLLHLPWRERH